MSLVENVRCKPFQDETKYGSPSFVASSPGHGYVNEKVAEDTSDDRNESYEHPEVSEPEKSTINDIGGRVTSVIDNDWEDEELPESDR